MDRLFRKLCNALMLLGGASVVLMMLNVTADVALKVFWNSPIQGTIEISSFYYMIAIVMLPLALVEYDDQQIVVDMVFNSLPAALQRGCIVLSCLAATVALSAIAWRTGQDAVRAFNVGEVVMGSREVVVWPSRCLLPIGFGLAAIAAFLRMSMAIRGYPVTRDTLHANTGEGA